MAEARELDVSETDVPATLDGGRYRIEKVIGTGGAARVLLALDTRMGVRRAIKLLHPHVARSESNRSRFKAEAHAQADLKHGNVLMVHDAIEDAQGVYLVMELAESDSLGQRVQASGPMPLRDVVEVGVAIGGALVVAHESGLIHRDIKPANILVDRHGVYKLADFGIARSEGREQELTQAGMVMGTWAFMPPEQREDSHQVDPRSDVYAFGVTLYALLKGRHAQSLHNQEAWAQAFAGVPSAFSAIIQRATRLYPEDRYPNMAAMVADLQRFREALLRSSVDVEALAGPGAPMGQLGAQTLVGTTAVPPLDDGKTFLPDLIPSGDTTGMRPARSRAPLMIGLTVGVGLLCFLSVVGAGLYYLRDHLFEPGPSGGPALVAGGAEQGAKAPAAEGPSTVAAPMGEQPPPASTEPVTAPTSIGDPVVTTGSVGSNRDPAKARTSSSSSTESRDPVGSTSGSGKETRVITVINTEPPLEGSTGGTASTHVVAPAEPMGKVVLRTVPSGASVKLRGRLLSPGAGGAFELPVGSHTLELVSTEGETIRLPVSVSSGESVSVCYNFDSNSACGGAP